MITLKNKQEKSSTRSDKIKQKFRELCLEELEKYFVFDAVPNMMGSGINARFGMTRIANNGARFFPRSNRNISIWNNIALTNEFISETLTERQFNKIFRNVIRDLVKKVYDDLFMWGDIAQQKLSLEEILKLENIEQRMAALKIYGIERLIQDTDANLIDKSERGNELYRIDKLFDTPAYFLKYKDISTDRIYFSGIDSAIFDGKLKSKITADRAMAWKFNWRLEQYNKLKIES